MIEQNEKKNGNKIKGRGAYFVACWWLHWQPYWPYWSESLRPCLLVQHHGSVPLVSVKYNQFNTSCILSNWATFSKSQFWEKQAREKNHFCIIFTLHFSWFHLCIIFVLISTYIRFHFKRDIIDCGVSSLHH